MYLLTCIKFANILGSNERGSFIILNNDKDTNVIFALKIFCSLASVKIAKVNRETCKKNLLLFKSNIKKKIGLQIERIFLSMHIYDISCFSYFSIFSLIFICDVYNLYFNLLFL